MGASHKNHDSLLSATNRYTQDKSGRMPTNKAPEKSMKITVGGAHTTDETVSTATESKSPEEEFVPCDMDALF